MEMIFCFCGECLSALDPLASDTIPAFLYAYPQPKCANCGKNRKLVGTRKFEVDLVGYTEKNGVCQHTEYKVVRYIAETSEVGGGSRDRLKNYLLLISCSQRKVETSQAIPAIDFYDGPVYRTLRKLGREGRFPDNVAVLIISARYGLIPLGMPIETYDEKMTAQRADELRQEIQKRLKVFMAYKPYDQVFINLGKVYMQTLEGFHWGLVSTLEASGGIGQKTSQMKAWLERIRGVLPRL